jgi:hypothetical protein
VSRRRRCLGNAFIKVEIGFYDFLDHILNFVVESEPDILPGVDPRRGFERHVLVKLLHHMREGDAVFRTDRGRLQGGTALLIVALCGDHYGASRCRERAPSTSSFIHPLRKKRAPRRLAGGPGGRWETKGRKPRGTCMTARRADKAPLRFGASNLKNLQRLRLTTYRRAPAMVRCRFARIA